MSARSYTRRQLMVEGRKRLPHGFQEVEYVQNGASGAYINTGIKAKSTIKIDTNVMPLQSAIAGMFGAAYQHAPYCALLYRINAYSNSNFYYGNGRSTSINLTVNKKWHIVMDKGKLYYDGTLRVTRTWGDYGDSGYNIMICRAADYGTWLSQRYYDFKIYDDDVLVRDYVPCINLSTNKAGMYDLVTKTFYGSANSANFTAGKIVY